MKDTIKIGANTFEVICYTAKIDINTLFDMYGPNLNLIPKLKKGEDLLNNYIELNKKEKRS